MANYISQLNLDKVNYSIKDNEARNLIQELDDNKAPKISPTFTGTPKAPDTSNPLTNSQIITLNDLTKKINDLALKEASKRDIDVSPVEGSKKLVESGGVYSEIQNINNIIEELQADLQESLYLVPVTTGDNLNFEIDRPFSSVIQALENGKNPCLAALLDYDTGDGILSIVAIFHLYQIIEESLLLFKTDVSFLNPLFGMANEKSGGFIYAMLQDRGETANGTGSFSFFFVPQENHASEFEDFGLGNEYEYGHVKLSDEASSNNVSSGVAATPKALSDVKTDFKNQINALKEQITNKQFYITVEETTPGAYIADKTIEEIANALEAGKLLYCIYQVENGEFILPLNINLTDENKIVFANDFIYDALAISFDINTSEIIVANEKLAPENHADETDKYGVGDATYYGHLKLSDTVNKNLDSSKGVAATPKVLSDIQDSLNNNIDTKADKKTGIFYIEGTGTTDTTNKVATWVGSHDDIINYYEGLMIAYKIGTAGSTTTTLNINNLGAITVVKNNTTAISTNFPINAVIFLVYTLDGDKAYWKAHDYDANTRNSVGDYRKNSTKLYFVGTTTSDASTSSSYATSYTNSYCYVGTDNCLYAYHAGNAKSEKVAFAVDLVALQNKINEKAPIDSPTFIGDPKAPTPPINDNDTSIATTAFVQTAINNVLSASSAMTFKGAWNFMEPSDTDIAILSIPFSGDIGDTYIIAGEGQFGEEICQIGDLIICITSYTNLTLDSDNVKEYWVVVQTNINGAVTGPTSSINENIAIFDGTTGKVITDSGITKMSLSDALNTIDDHEERIGELEPLKRSDYVYLTANQALTNKTYNGYTLKDASACGVDATPQVNSNNLVKSGGLYTKFEEVNNRFNEIEGKKHALSDTIDGDALKAKAVSITRPANILTAAGDMATGTEQIFFNGSDGTAAGGPVNYIIVNAKKGDNHRTILDCYDLQTGDHYINGCMNANSSSTASGANVWTGWKLQPSPSNTYTKTEVNNLIDAIPDNPTGFTITPSLTDDNVVNLTGSAKTNGFNLGATHAAKGPANGYTSGNTTTSISGYGTSKTIKIPQITVDSYGHVNAAADESITITLPAAPALKIFTAQNTSVPANSWVSSTFDSMYPFQATINISNLTSTDIVSPKYNNMDLIKYMISPKTTANNGNIVIYAVNKPTVAITIPQINYYKTT